MRLRGRGDGGMKGRRAIIDIGSNTVRLVVYGPPDRAPAVLINEKVTARLGKGLADNGLLTEKSMAAALTALRRFVTLLKLDGVRDVETVATAAARDAGNGPAFLEAVRALGLKPRLLSGEEEAVTSAMGVAGAFAGAKGIVADLGGGSLELVHIDDGVCEHGTSLPFGTLRLPALRTGGTAKFAQRVKKALSGAEWHCAPGETLYLVGGSHRALARHAMHRTGWPLDDPHGFAIAPETMLDICRRVQRRDLGSEPAGPPAGRLASLPDTAALLAVVIGELRPERLIFSSWGLREGLLYRSLPGAIRAQDPLLAGITAFAGQMGCPPDVAARVAAWTRPALAMKGEKRETLRLAATLLALASQRVEPNLRGEHILDWAMRKRWIGADPEARAMMAACALANAGRGVLPDRFVGLASPAALEEAAAWGLAIRLCRRFSGLSARALAAGSLEIGDGRLTLSLQPPADALVSEVVDKDLRGLADRLGLEPRLVVT